MEITFFTLIACSIYNPPMKLRKTQMKLGTFHHRKPKKSILRPGVLVEGLNVQVDVLKCFILSKNTKEEMENAAVDPSPRLFEDGS